MRHRPLAAQLRPSRAGRPALQERGRGECRALAAPMARLRKKMQAAGTTGSAETSRHSPRDGFHAYVALSPVSGFLATVAVRIIITRRLGASFGAPGPRVFTSASLPFVGEHEARCSALAATASPAPRLVTIAKRPSRGPGCGEIYMISEKMKEISFSRKDGPGPIRVRHNKYLVMCRVPPLAMTMLTEASPRLPPSSRRTPGPIDATVGFAKDDDPDLLRQRTSRSMGPGVRREDSGMCGHILPPRISARCPYCFVVDAAGRFA